MGRLVYSHHGRLGIVWSICYHFQVMKTEIKQHSHLFYFDANISIFLLTVYILKGSECHLWPCFFTWTFLGRWPELAVIMIMHHLLSDHAQYRAGLVIYDYITVYHNILAILVYMQVMWFIKRRKKDCYIGAFWWTVFLHCCGRLKQIPVTLKKK